MKQSIGLVLLQIFGILLGLISVFWVAGSLPAEEYAIVGIYNIISALIVVFSNTGFETYAIRNVLAWREAGENDKIKLIVSQAIIYRMILAILVFIPLIGYIVYISLNKFEGQYFSLFFTMGLLSVSNAFNDSTILILKAFNKYFVAALATYTINVFGKLAALLLFIKFGFGTYIWTIILLPVFVSIPLIYMLKDWFSFKNVFKKEYVIDSLKKSKFFALSAYLSYASSYLDQLIVSIFMSPEVIGAFTLSKSILQIVISFIENIFDPLIQNLVRFKNDIFEFRNKMKFIFKIRNIVLILSILGLPILVAYINDILALLKIDHYPYLNYFIIFIYLSQIGHIAMKVKYSYISLFHHPKFYLNLMVFRTSLSIFLLAIILFINVKYVFTYILITNLFLIGYTNHIYRNMNKSNIYIK